MARPVLRMQMTAPEVIAFNAAFRASSADPDLHLSLGDQLVVRQMLQARIGDVDPSELADWLRRADKCLAPAFERGIAVALAYMDRPEHQVNAALAAVESP